MIPIQNIYYMLSYAFCVLSEQGYKNVSTEQFSNTAELCAAILIRGISIQLKRGLRKEYIPNNDALSAIRGKIDLSESTKRNTTQKKKIVCTYDDFSINFYMNRIIKTTIELLIRLNISKAQKKELRKLFVFFNNVEVLDYKTINWRFQYNRNNQTYQMLISICYLILKGLIQTTSDGTTRLMDFIDEKRMSRLYEKFILEYYKREHPELKAKAAQIPWQLDDGSNAMLPVMQSDITLSKDEKTLIIDAKYYSKIMQTQYNTHSIHSGNLYQIFTYVKNKEYQLSGQPHKVSGMLLYAKSDEETYPNNTYQMSGNKISVRTLALDCSFSQIASQLDAIASEHFS